MTSASKKNKSTPITGLNQKRYEELVLLRDRLVAQLRVLAAEAFTDSDQTGKDLADAGTEDFLRNTELVLLGEEGKRLALVQEALRRLDEGTYGRCIDCGKRIQSARLDAIPYAKLCVDCKALREANDGIPPQDAQDAGAFDRFVE
ncbi:MAG: TraR/DksA family transcriptional regulator [Kiritimatiellaeota bacterium]|nr:TraR/DksA family transcriptional regulator [Kiritimatiellota bacterium]